MADAHGTGTSTRRAFLVAFALALVLVVVNTHLAATTSTEEGPASNAPDPELDALLGSLRAGRAAIAITTGDRSISTQPASTSAGGAGGWFNPHGFFVSPTSGATGIGRADASGSPPRMPSTADLLKDQAWWDMLHAANFTLFGSGGRRPAVLNEAPHKRHQRQQQGREATPPRAVVPPLPVPLQQTPALEPLTTRSTSSSLPSAASSPPDAPSASLPAPPLAEAKPRVAVYPKGQSHGAFTSASASLPVQPPTAATSHVAAATKAQPFVAATPVSQGSQFSYVMLLSTSREEARYIGYLSGILVARRALLDAGSQADFWLLIVSTPDVPRFTPQVESLLTRNGVQFRYVTTPWKATAGVSGVMLAKIYCWTLTQYKRVLYIDSDVFPKSNMDHYFTLPPRTTGCAGSTSPFNGGWVLLFPSMDTHYRLAELIQRRGKLVDDKQPPNWDNNLGWGHPLPAWVKYGSVKETGAGWGFTAAWSDQGLMYYYFRFLDELDVMTFRDHDKKKPARLRYAQGRLVKVEDAPDFSFDLFEHFAGPVKPWNICPQPSEQAMQRQVNQIAPPKLKSDKQKLEARWRGFWRWHAIYNSLNVDMPLHQLVGVMTRKPGSCKGH